MQSKKKELKFQMPHLYVTLACVIAFMTILTYIVPAGNFERRTVEIDGVNRSIVIPGTYKANPDAKPVSPVSMMMAPYKGMIKTADVVFLTFLVYASFYLVVRTGSLDGFIALLIKLVGDKQWLVIPFFTILFGIGGSMFGMLSEFYGFIPVFVGLSIALGYDGLVGFAIVILGSYIGFMAGTTNPFNVVVAQGISELPIYSGLSVRYIILAIFMTLTIAWIMMYAARVKKNPDSSYIKGIDLKLFDIDRNNLDQYKITKRNVFVLLLVAACMITLCFGTLKYKWGLEYIVAIFLTMGLGSAAIMGLRPSEIAEETLNGIRNIAFGAMSTGIARGVLVVLEEGNIIDSLMNGVANALTHFPPWLTAVGMLLAQTIVNFFIPSGTGQAATTMPLMIGIADLLGVTRQVAVTAFHFGDGLSNLLWPTCGIVVVCGIAGIPLQKWWKFFVPLFSIFLGLQAVIIIILSITNFS